MEGVLLALIAKFAWLLPLYSAEDFQIHPRFLKTSVRYINKVEMSVSSAFSLFFSVLWAVFITHLICIRELFHFLIWGRRMKSVKGSVVVVTGSGHGLGRRIARNFARLGATVVCWDYDHERNESTVFDIKNEKGNAISVICDVTDRTQVFKTAKDIHTNFGKVDIFVNCVGIYPVKDVLSWTPEELYTLFDTNVLAQFWLLQAFIPHMIQMKAGHFVAISSAAAIAPVPNEVPYSVTKAAVTGLMEGYIQELKLQQHKGIKITCIHPYYTACRDDIPVKFDLRFERQSPDFVAKEIVKGIRQEREIISVPRFMLFWIIFMKLLPQKARSMWRDIFYTRVFPLDNTANMYKEDGTVKNIVEQYKLPPLKRKSFAHEHVNIVKVECVKDEDVKVITPENIV